MSNEDSTLNILMLERTDAAQDVATSAAQRLGRIYSVGQRLERSTIRVQN